MSGQCWSVPSVWNIYSLGWSPHLWVRALGLSPVSTGCIAQTQIPSCETCRLLWFLCDYTCNKAGRITFILLFWGIWGLFSKVCILVPLMPVLLVPWCFGNSLSPWDLVWFEYKPMGTCQFFIHKLGKLKLNKSVNKPGKSIWSQWSCADLFQPETLSRLEHFWGCSWFLLSQSSSRTPLLISVLIHFIWPSTGSGSSLGTGISIWTYFKSCLY